jgi:hypothetical protein
MTPPAQRELAETAKELGFVLLNTYERAVVAELLYRSPRWCRDLLGISTVRPALSAFPQDRRPFFDQQLRGRDDELKWLKGRTSDTLVVGQPGIGKTFLLRRFSQETEGLFAVTDDLSAIDPAIRESQPKIIIVSDAHARPGLLQGLRQLRRDTGGTWKIVADCWPGARIDVRSILSLASPDVLELRPLARDIIVEIIHDAGVAGPTELVRELVDQSRGRAGLAVTLTFLCLQGDTRLVGIGRVLAEQVETTFRTLVGVEAINALTMLSLGGSGGLALSDVADELKQPIVQVQQAVVHLAAGGVVEEVIEYGGNRRIVVQPEALREALVSDRFFGKYPIPLPNRLLQTARQAAVTEVFLGAAHRGGAVPDDLLWNRLAEHGTPSLFKSYTALGEPQAQRVLADRADLLADVAPTGLRVAPAAFLPRLLEASLDDNRDTGSATSHPLRQVEDWVHSGRPGGEALPRRRNLIDAVENWLLSGGDPDIAVRAASLALVPAFRTSNLDPGSGRMFTLTHGVITSEEVVGLGELWRRAIGFIPPMRVTKWQPLINAIRGVASPQILGGNPGDAFYAASDELARKLVDGLARIAAARPGVMLELRGIATWLDIEFNASIDGDFATIYPDDDFADHNAWFKRATEEAQGLAVRLASRPASEIAKLLAFYESEAETVGRTTAMLFVLGNALAENISNPKEWIEVFAKACGIDEIAAPILRRLYREDYRYFIEACRLCWGNNRLRVTVINAVLTADKDPEDLMKLVLEELPKYIRLVEILCLRGQVPIATLRKLLVHDHDGVAAASAYGEWNSDPKGVVRPEVQECWRPAILRCGSKQQRQTIKLYIRDILASDADLAFDWLLARIHEGAPLFELEDYDLDGAIPTLSPDQRLALLTAIGPNEIYVPDDFVTRLIAGDANFYRRLLAEPTTKRLHLLALIGHPSPAWATMALAAMDAGYSPAMVRDAAGGSMRSWSGEQSVYWESWRNGWEMLLQSDDLRLKEVARLGIDEATALRDRSLAEEEKKRIDGD